MVAEEKIDFLEQVTDCMIYSLGKKDHLLIYDHKIYDQIIAVRLNYFQSDN